MYYTPYYGKTLQVKKKVKINLLFTLMLPPPTRSLIPFPSNFRYHFKQFYIKCVRKQKSDKKIILFKRCSELHDHLHNSCQNINRVIFMLAFLFFFSLAYYYTVNVFGFFRLKGIFKKTWTVFFID